MRLWSSGACLCLSTEPSQWKAGPVLSGFCEPGVSQGFGVTLIVAWCMCFDVLRRPLRVWSSLCQIQIRIDYDGTDRHRRDGVATRCQTPPLYVRARRFGADGPPLKAMAMLCGPFESQAQGHASLANGCRHERMSLCPGCVCEGRRWLGRG